LQALDYEFSGHHSDVFLSEIYHLLAAFFFKTE
jgi:hypothetical protein